MDAKLHFVGVPDPHSVLANLWRTNLVFHRAGHEPVEQVTRIRRSLYQVHLAGDAIPGRSQHHGPRMDYFFGLLFCRFLSACRQRTTARIDSLMGSRAAYGVGVVHEYAFDVLVIEQTGTVNEFVQYPRGQRLSFGGHLLLCSARCMGG